MDNTIQLTLAFQEKAYYRYAFVAFHDTSLTAYNDSTLELTLTYGDNGDEMKSDLLNRLNPQNVILVDFALKGPMGDFRSDLAELIRKCMLSANVFLAHPIQEDVLHRFRVDLRTLRSFLYYARHLKIDGFQTLSLKLKLLSKSSNAARDNEVMAMLYKQYGSKYDPIPVVLSALRMEEAADVLRRQATEVWIDGIAEIMKAERHAEFHDSLEVVTRKRWKKLKRRCFDLDMKNDVSMHRLRIDLKKLSAALRVLLSHDYEVASRLDQVKTIQSELGQIRDLRRFYILPGLDAQTRYRAVTQLTTLEERFKERFDPKSN